MGGQASDVHQQDYVGEGGELVVVVVLVSPEAQIPNLVNEITVIAEGS